MFIKGNLFFLFLCFLFFSDHLWAANFALSSKRSMTDLMFLPSEKKFVGTSKIQTEVHKTEFYYLNLRYEKIENKSFSFSQSLGYALTNSMFLNLSWDYLVEREKTYTYGPASSYYEWGYSRHFSGLKDPELVFRGRLIEQSLSSVHFDLWGLLSPQLEKSKMATHDKEGNATRGYNSYAIGAEIGKKYVDVAWAVKTKLTSFTQGKAYNVETGDLLIESDPYRIFETAFLWQWSWDNFSLDLMAAMGFVGEKDGGNFSGSIRTSTEEDLHRYTSLGIKSSWMLVKEKLNIFFNINIKSYEDHDYHLGELLLEVRDENESNVDFGVKYQF